LTPVDATLAQGHTRPLPTPASKRGRGSEDEGIASALRAVEQLTGAELIEKPKNKHAQALSKLGASNGGEARAAKLSAAKRKAIAKKAVAARWAREPA
jgi:hypothetical protein